MASHPCRAVLRPRQHNDSVGSSELPRSSSLASVGCWLDVRVGPMPNSVHESVSSAVRGGRAVCALLCAAAPTDRDTGAPPRRRQVSASQGTSCSETLTASRPARSGSTRRPPSCGRGWRRWSCPAWRRLHPRLDREPAGPRMHSVDQVLPAYQHPQIGDTISLGSNRMRVERVDPEHVLAWRSRMATGSGRSRSRSEAAGHVSSAAIGSAFRR
jgi:hypothetical protein